MASNKSDRLGMAFLPSINPVQSRSGSSTQNPSPVEPATSNSNRIPFGSNGVSSIGPAMANGQRKGTGSPSHEIGGSRLFSKRAREIQAQEGVSPSLWGPPTSGNSTPLRENIPESPTDGFPDFTAANAERLNSSNTSGRARAGTVPSQFSPGRALNGLGIPSVSHPKTSRPTPSTTPSTTPFKSHSPAPGEGRESEALGSTSANSSLLSRLRSGSLPQRSNLLTGSSPFGPSLFSTNWNPSRERSTTLSSILSSDGPLSPTQSAFSREGPGDNELRTLDYLGLVDTPQAAQALLVNPNSTSTLDGQSLSALQPFMANLATLNKGTNRYRSYSVNAKEKYAAEEDEEEAELQSSLLQPLYQGSSLDPAASIAAAAAATHAEIHRHNLAVQAFAKQTSANRPRSITVGALESPQSSSLRSYLAPRSRLENSITASDLPTDLLESIISMQAGSSAGIGKESVNPESGIDGPTRALWLGSIPASTTVSSLTAIFGTYGTIESARVLTHKNCGFVNFETIESASQAKAVLNGKEIFPGAGPVRIGYAKVPDASSTGTPGNNGTLSSPSPDILGKSLADGSKLNRDGASAATALADASYDSEIPTLQEMKPYILSIIKDLGASDQDSETIRDSIDQALSFAQFAPEIPSIPEPSHNRLHDAPRLREIRKRIDNNSYSQPEIEDIARAMLPEIVELSSDYLGNTVVQKLFEFCSEDMKELMLGEIAPHLAEIGVHKNGTWAAQKIIDVARTPTQMNLIVEHLRPYTVGLFLDQYGNYVLQCCLRFGAPWNNFIFETMISRLWDIAQGRFGSRAMRACLESHHSTKEQQRMLAAAIALNSVRLATNTNGALLLTWLLDTCNFPRRRSILAPRLVAHIVQLCTHKVAYLTVLKVINQPKEPEARDLILRALFYTQNDEVLEKIIADQSCGATLIFKVLTTPFFDEAMRSEVVQSIRNVLVRIRAQPAQGYKRLMDEVGLPTRSGAGGPGSRDRSLDARAGHSPARRAGSQQRNSAAQSHHHSHGQDRSLGGQYIGNSNGTTEVNQPIQQNSNLDPATIQAFEQFNLNNIGNQMFTPNPNLPLTPLSPQQLQWQQQQLLIAQAQAQAQANARTLQSSQFYNGFTPGLGGYPTPSPSIESFRNQPIGSGVPGTIGNGPSMIGQGFAPSPGFSPLAGNQMLPNNFGYPANGIGGVGFFSPQQGPQPPMNQGIGGGRRGRVGR